MHILRLRIRFLLQVNDFSQAVMLGQLGLGNLGKDQTHSMKEKEFVLDWTEIFLFDQVLY